MKCFFIFNPYLFYILFSFITLTAKFWAYEFKSKGPITNLNSSIMLDLAIPYPTLTPTNPYAFDKVLNIITLENSL